MIGIGFGSCDQLFTNESPNYLYDLDMSCINNDKADSMKREFLIDSLNNPKTRSLANILYSKSIVKNIWHLHAPEEYIAFNDVWDIQNVINNKISDGVIYNRNIPQSEIKRIGKRVENLLYKANCQRHIDNNTNNKEEQSFYTIGIDCISGKAIDYLNENHAIDLIRDSLTKEVAIYFKFLSDSNHVYFFENPSELIALSSDYKDVIYYYSKTLKSFSEGVNKYEYNYSEQVPNKVIIFPAGYQLKLSNEEKERIGNRLERIFNELPCER